MLIHFAAVLCLVGAVSSQTNCSEPESVSQLKAESNSVSSIAVQWEPPSNTECLEGYQVCWSLVDGTQSNCTTQTLQELETTNITGLTGCTNYVVNVTSVGSSGDYSETVNITTSSAPEKMRRVQIWSSFVSNITAVWTLPSHTQCLQGIQVCLSPRDGNQSNCTIQSPHAHAALTFTELTPCSHYIVNVTTISLSGEYSEAVTVSAVSAPALSQLNNFRAVSTSSGIQLYWEAPTEGTECLEEYSVCWKITGDSTTNCTSQSVDLPPSLNFTEPEICANYTFTLTASGVRGESGGTTASAIISLTPDSISSLKTRSVGPSVIVTWTPPSEHPRCAEQYEICWEASLDDRNCTVQDSSVTTLDITRLNYCSEYLVGVRALGRPDNSSQVNATATTGPEGVSQFKAVNFSVSYIAVQWEPPSNTDCLEEYQVCWSLADGTQSNCTTQTIQELETTNITGLTGCTNYVVNVTSVGSSGGYSETVNITTSSAPEKVKRVKILSSYVSNITAVWTLPSHTQCLQGIQVCLSPRDGNQTNCTIQSSHAHAALTFTELTPCSHYIVNVTTISSSGEYSDAVTVSAVSAPSITRVNNPRAFATSSSSIQLDWEAPTEGTECLKEYSVCQKIVNTPSNDCINHAVDLETTLNYTDVEICTNYSFILGARGERGEGASTTVWAIISLTPGNVSSLETLSVGPSVLATWTPPSYRPQCVVHYEICWGSSPDDQNCTIQENNVTTFDITELTPCGEYIVGVRALGKPDNSSQVNTTAIAAPKPARSLTFSFANATSIVAEWEAPIDQSDCIDYYQACLVVAGKTVCVNQTRDITTAYIPDLRSCTSYTVNVTAWTDGARSSILSEQVNTTAAVPDVPNHLHVNYADGNLMNVQWRVPTVNYECVECYNICWKEATEGQTESCDNSTDLQYLITGLDGCGKYSVNVIAVGSIGSSKASQVVARTRTKVYGVSQLEAVNITVSSLAVQWGPPSNTGCLEGYQVCWSLTNKTEINCTTKSRYELEATSITGLTLCTNYVVNVISLGSSGTTSTPVNITTSSAPEKMKRVQIWSSFVSNITAVWTLPSHTQCLQGIQVCLSPRDGNQSNCTIQSPHAHAALTFTELTPCSHYIVNVTTISLSGEYSEAVTASAVSAPALSEVNNFRAVSTSSGIQLYWEAPTEGTECLEEYSVCWKITGDSTTNCTSQSVDLPPSLSLTEPEICANYTFTLTASGVRGESGGTTALAIISQTPDSISSLETRSVGPSVIVTWTPPSEHPRCVEQYEICWEASLDDRNCTVQDSSVTTLDITRLNYCSEYLVGVRALGRPDNSSQVNATATTGPEGVSQFKAVNFSVSYIAVQWEPPSNTDCLEEYQVCWSLVDGTQSNCTTQTIQELETTNITGLTGCTNYVVNVTSVGSSGGYSETVNITTSSAPERVKRVQVYSVYATNITVVWQLPSHTQCLQGIQVCLSPRDGNQSDCTIQSSHAHAAWTFTELTPCNSYHISVTAVSSSGDYSEAVTVSAESACDLQDHGLRLSSLENFLTNQYHPRCVEEYEFCLGSSQDNQNCNVTTLDITELTYCSEYLVGVTALRRPGNSSTVTADPRPAHNLTFLFAMATSIEAEWEAANVAMDCVDYYQVCLKVIGDETVCVSQTRDGTIMRIPDLLTCTSYTFNATARTEGDGRSVLSEQVNTRAAGSLNILISPVAIISLLFISMILTRWSD